MAQNVSSPQAVPASNRDNDSKRVSPPRARLALRVGVTGHRLNKLQSADIKLLRAQIRTALQFLKTTTSRLHTEAAGDYSPEPPVLRVISPLAEGSDRFVAEEGLALGFELQCPLPFPREEYEKDFGTEESRAQFHKLLAQANAILELDGGRNTPDAPARENESYEAAGRIVLNQSDVLIAIWNGAPGTKGGTSEIIAEAERVGIPIIWITSDPPHDLGVKKQGANERTSWPEGTELLSRRIEKLVLPPAQPKPKHRKKKPKPDLREAYFSERQRRLTFGFLWKLLRDLAADFKIRIPAIRVKPFEQSTQEEWRQARSFSPCLPPVVFNQLDERLSSHYAWADRLATYYAEVYRSAFVFNYLTGGFAVLFAFLSYVTHTRNFHSYEAYANKVGAIANVAEFITIVAIIFVTWYGNHRRWHERWIDYRLLGEQLRQQRFLMPLARVLPSAPGMPVYVSDDDPNNSWMQWHFRAIVRAAGMVGMRFDDAYLRAVCLFVRSLFAKTEDIDGQIEYHQGNADRLERADSSLHAAGYVLFGLALFGCSLHLLNYCRQWLSEPVFGHEGGVALFLTFLTVVGPAFGGALTAIRFQGEFERVIERSRAMKGQLEKISVELGNCQSGGAKPSSEALGEIATSGAQLMVSEVLDWRTVFLARPLGLPG